MTGKVDQKYNYCQQNGYETEIIKSTRELSCPDSNECVVCILPDGAKVEVTELMDLKKLASIDVAVCADENCSQKSKSFTQGETVYFKINKHINLDISSTIKTPSGEIKYLTFENNLAVFQSDEIGEFSLWVNISEGEYKKQKIEKDFVYVKKTDEVPAAENGSAKFYILAVAILLIIGIAGIVLYRRKVKANTLPIQGSIESEETRFHSAG